MNTVDVVLNNAKYTCAVQSILNGEYTFYHCKIYSTSPKVLVFGFTFFLDPFCCGQIHVGDFVLRKQYTEELGLLFRDLLDNNLQNFMNSRKHLLATHNDDDPNPYVTLLEGAGFKTISSFQNIKTGNTVYVYSRLRDTPEANVCEDCGVSELACECGDMDYDDTEDYD